MRILFVLENHYPNIGGVETLFKGLTEHLVSSGHEVTILTNKFDKRLASEEVLNGVLIKRVPFYNRYLFTLFAFFPAWKLAWKNDLIHTTSYNAGVPAFFAGLFSRTKVIITFHEVWGGLWFELPFMGKASALLHYLFEQFLLRLPFTKFVAVSDSTLDSLHAAGLSEKKLVRIFNGVVYDEPERPAEQREQSKRPYAFLYFGRLGISKGLDLLMEAVRITKGRGYEFLLHLVIPKEPKPFHDKIRSLISELDIEDRVSVQSELKRKVLEDLIVDSDAVVIPSYSEGFCFTAVESITLGTPVISSGRGSLSEVVTGQHIVMKEHTALGLAQAMERALAEDWDHEPVRKFPLDISISEYETLYHSILN